MRFIAICLFVAFFTLTAGDFILVERAHQQSNAINDGAARYEAGLRLFKTHCQQCHGKWGDGQISISDLADISIASLQDDSTARTAKEIKRIIRDGGTAHELDPMMPGFKTVLSENEINEVAYFVIRLQHASGIRRLNTGPLVAD